MKTCSCCLVLKSDEFFFRKRNALEGYCKECKKAKSNRPDLVVKRKSRQKKYRAQNPERERARTKKWAHENRDRVNEKIRKWRAAHPEVCRAAVKKWAECNPERIKEKNKKWRANNLEVCRASDRKWRKQNRASINSRLRKRAKESPRFRVERSLRRRLGHAVRSANTVKSDKTLTLVGCPWIWLESHLESKFKPGMTWENYGPVWHIDHVKPCAKFDLTDPEQQKLCFHWTNLQPLFALENLKKGDKYDETAILS